MRTPIPTCIAPSVRPAPKTSRQIEREFRQRLGAGARIRAAGTAKHRPRRLLASGYTPKHKVSLFDATFYLTNARQNPDIRFFVAYVTFGSAAASSIYPRIFYKDISLVWRSASHFVRSDQENWIGKGELHSVIREGKEVFYSAEETTDLPFEMQTALEMLNRQTHNVRSDDRAVELVLRRGPDDRVAAYRDFTGPKQRARADRRNLIHGGRKVAWFARKNDPTSLRFAAGFEPDFARGVLEVAALTSRMYGGRLQRFRILSRNQRIQYLFFAGPRHVWIIPPQATTTELTSYGVRSIDVSADDDIFLPGYEYHYLDESEDPPVFFSQIPPGFAGAPSDVDPSRADASAWLDRLPVIREFRSKLLAGRRRAAGTRA